MKRSVKLLAALVAAFLLLAGCQSDTTWTHSNSDGKLIPAGLYIYFQIQSFNEAFNTLYQAEMDEYLEALSAASAESADAAPAAEADDTKSVYEMEYDEVLAQTVEDMPVSQWIDQNSDRMARRFLAAQVKLGELNASMTGEDLAIYNNAARQAYASASYAYDENGNPMPGERYFTRQGISESSLATALQYSDTLARHFEKLYGKGGEFEVPEDEITTYFEDNFVRGQQLEMPKPTEADMPEVITPDGGELDAEAQAAVDALTETSESALATMEAELKTLADSLFEKMKAGETIENLTLEYDEFVSGVGTAELNETGSLDFIVLNDDYSGYSQDVVDGLTALEPGGSNLIETDTSFILIRRLDLMEKPGDLEDHRLGLLLDLRYEDDYLPKLDEWAGSLSITVNQNAITRYSSSKLDMTA